MLLIVFAHFDPAELLTLGPSVYSTIDNVCDGCRLRLGLPSRLQDLARTAWVG